MAIVSILFLATFVEGLTEYLFAQEGKVQPWLKYIALVLGVGAAVIYRVDLPATLGLTSGFVYANYVVSGLIIGRGSNYVNDIVTTFKQG